MAIWQVVGPRGFRALDAHVEQLEVGLQRGKLVRVLQLHANVLSLDLDGKVKCRLTIT